MSVSDRQPLPPELAAVVSALRPSGAFPSTIVRLRKPVGGVDENAFVTVQVLRTLSCCGQASWRVARRRGISFLERCEIAPDAFGFWPLDTWPSWMPRFGPDVDDTALIAEVLYADGRIDRNRLLRVAATLSSARIRRVERIRPMWINRGAFGTWIDGPPIVDCAVNANVAAFLAAIGRRGEFGYDDAVRTVTEGVDWAGSSSAKLRTLAPFYPHPGELRMAMINAIARGVDEFAEPLAVLDDRFGNELAVDATSPVCGSAYGAVDWYAPVIAAARGIAFRALEAASRRTKGA